MSPTVAIVTFYITIVVGYIWAAVQLIVGEPFDAAILFIVTYSYHSYRLAVRRENEL